MLLEEQYMCFMMAGGMPLCRIFSTVGVKADDFFMETGGNADDGVVVENNQFVIPVFPAMPV